MERSNKKNKTLLKEKKGHSRVGGWNFTRSIGIPLSLLWTVSRRALVDAELKSNIWYMLQLPYSGHNNLCTLTVRKQMFYVAVATVWSKLTHVSKSLVLYFYYYAKAAALSVSTVYLGFLKACWNMNAGRNNEMTCGSA